LDNSGKAAKATVFSQNISQSTYRKHNNNRGHSFTLPAYIYQMSLISKNDIIKATGTARLPALATLLMRLMKIDAFNNMMQQAGILRGVEFTSFVLQFLGITIRVDEEDLANIPASGAFIAVANHPYGAVESLALLNLLVSRRPDTLFMGNFLLKRVPNLADYIIAVNPFEKIKDSSSISGLKNTLGQLRSGTPVAIFPAGEVSAFDFKTQRVTDREWHPVVGKLIAKAGAPVLPIYFHGDNGLGSACCATSTLRSKPPCYPPNFLIKKEWCCVYALANRYHPRTFRHSKKTTSCCQYSGPKRMG
jgi:putative hemolysin